MTQRTPAGRFAPGVSGNPEGRPALPAEYREQIRSHTPAAVAVLHKALSSLDERVAVAAAKEILDRGWGKPPMMLDTTIRQEVSMGEAHLRALIRLNQERRSEADAEADDEEANSGLPANRG